MSPIGRILLVVNLALSAIFLGWAANALSTSQNWKDQYATLQEEMQTTVAAKESEITSLQAEKSNAEEQNRRLREEKNRFELEAGDLRAQLQEQKSRNDELATNVTAIQAKLGDFNDTIAQLSEAKDRAMERAAQAERDRDQAQSDAQAAELARRDAADAQRESEKSIMTLEANNKSLQDQLAQAETRLQVAIQTGNLDRPDIEAVPQIEAAVLDVRAQPSPGLVMLNVGKDRQVKPGYTFDIYRGNTYKGRVRVENVQESVCSALIQWSVDGQTIRQGDLASTRL